MTLPPNETHYNVEIESGGLYMQGNELMITDKCKGLPYVLPKTGTDFDSESNLSGDMFTKISDTEKTAMRASANR